MSRIVEGEPTVAALQEASDRLGTFRDLIEARSTSTWIAGVVDPETAEPFALIESDGDRFEVVRVIDKEGGCRAVSWFRRPEGVCRLVCLARAIGELGETAGLDRDVIVHVLEGIGQADEGTHPADLLNFYDSERIADDARLLHERPIRKGGD